LIGCLRRLFQLHMSHFLVFYQTIREGLGRFFVCFLATACFMFVAQSTSRRGCFLPDVSPQSDGQTVWLTALCAWTILFMKVGGRCSSSVYDVLLRIRHFVPSALCTADFFFFFLCMKVLCYVCDCMPHSHEFQHQECLLTVARLTFIL
jgi:hypothetical protein